MEDSDGEANVLTAICCEVKSRGSLSEEHLTRIRSLLGSRFEKAWEIISDKRVKKYLFKPSGRVVWIVVGRERDYLVMPAVDFCQCDDFYYHVKDGTIHLCKHLIAQKLAECVGAYDKIEDDDEFYVVLMKEWKEVTP